MVPLFYAMQVDLFVCILCIPGLGSSENGYDCKTANLKKGNHFL